MGQVLGMGLTHYPRMMGPDANMPDILRWALNDPDLPVELKDPQNWPEQMREEWGEDEGLAASAFHRARLVENFKKCREEIDRFEPDFVLVWGDDQYENFREEVIPAFCVMAYDDIQVRPFGHMELPNLWDVPNDTPITLKGRREYGKHLTDALLAENFDVAYSYRPRDPAEFPHAFANTALYLDTDRQGFPYPVLPVSLNCYGRSVISRKGGMVRLRSLPEDLDPRSPSPRRCFELGAAVGKALSASPWRVALVASSSWSHAFLHDKEWHLHPAMESDRAFYDALVSGDQGRWLDTPLETIEANGQQEILNWYCLLGAVSELGLTRTWSDFVETYVLNSNKCFAVYE